ncbi:hypothetical protein COW20_15200 [bacterium (Candidatus Blackallbacteria) CG13_big_fil_rev_8_21_14_2_50_49_14]|nr:MAG: hypothetical protein COW64_15040 [bacterium (Candidatus Blackallbacteria) CG18_big_fil_WC_8_21_14_2_50_49_26]PIW46634.1 MAG: hypothetical protein COW20_15200 [bacterium (Candidatus Blackallbacteria) CG13_big_fil_rev_8_21_14_2_50_49_14]
MKPESEKILFRSGPRSKSHFVPNGIGKALCGAKAKNWQKVEIPSYPKWISLCVECDGLSKESENA